MHTQNSPADPAPIRNKLAVACVLALWSAHASIGWEEGDNAPESAELIVSYVDLEPAEPAND